MVRDSLRNMHPSWWTALRDVAETGSAGSPDARDGLMACKLIEWDPGKTGQRLTKKGELCFQQHFGGTMAGKKAETIKDDLGEAGAELLASAIVDVASAAKKLLASRLTEEAVLVLLKHSTGLPMKDIKAILKAAADLQLRYVKKGSP